MSPNLIMELDQELAALAVLTTADLQLRWRKVFATEPPRRMRSKFLRLAIAYRLQELALGGLSPDTKRDLQRLAKSLRKDQFAQPTGPQRAPRFQLANGSQLLREWNGKMELVDVVDGGFVWRGTTHRTLTAVAVAITGTKWSGPKFFGLDRPRLATPIPNARAAASDQAETVG